LYHFKGKISFTSLEYIPKPREQRGGVGYGGRVMVLTTLKKEDYPKMMRFLENSYQHTKNFFPLRYPKVWGKNTVDWNNKLIIKEKGEIASHVGIFILPAEADGVSFKLGGIGGVATLPQYRGKGYMSKLLKHTFQKMKEQGCPLSWLGGDRQRYGAFGYETAGKMINFIVSPRSLSHTVNPEPIELIRYAGQEDLLEKIISLHEKEPLRVKRSQLDYQLLMDRYGVITYLGRKRNKWAYLTLRGERASNQVIELGGDISVLASLFGSLFKHYGYGNLGIGYPYYPTRIFSLLREVASGWQVSPTGMIKILNLRQTLEAFLPQIEKKRKAFPQLLESKPKIEFTLQIKDTKQTVNLEIGEKVGIREKGKREKLVLSDREMVNLLFGTFSPHLLVGKVGSLLNLIFPLDFYVWPLDHI